MAFLHRQTFSKAFTIVEILVVISVMGIVASIGIVSYNGYQERARAAAAIAGVNQATDLLEAYQLKNGGLYPTTLAAAGVTDTDSVKYQYTRISGGTDYCVTATNKNVSYKMTQDAKPTAGGCAGHGANGVIAITNFTPNPSYETATSSTALYNGATVTREAVAYADSGSYVGRITKGTAGATLVFMVYPIPWTANSTISVRFKIRLSPGSTATNTISPSIQTYQSGSGKGGATGCSVQNPSSLSASSWSDVILGGCTTPNVTMNSIGVMVTPGQAWAATDGVEIDSILITDTSTIGAFRYGDSPNWVWNGVPNQSTSTGTP